jgi:MinD-like ATPase involved in chromosome partitioning or flagellar assembly
VHQWCEDDIVTDRDSDDSKERPEEQPAAAPAPEESRPGTSPAPRHPASHAAPEPPTAELPQPAFGPSQLPSEAKTTEVKTTEVKTTELRQRPHPPAPGPAHNGGDSGWPAGAAEPLLGQRGEAPPRVDASREQPRWQAPPPPAATATNWSYVEGLRASELVPTRKVPPGRGWRRALYSASFGLINLGPSAAERRRAELETRIRSLLRGHYKIGVLGKGGTGKTTVAAAVGSILASLRQDDRVVAIDADTAFGKLASRVDPRAAGSYWELAADQHLDSFADIRSRVGNNAAGLFVLAGEAATARRRVLNPQIYREATARLDNHFTISVVDCGSTMDSAVTAEVLRDLDALIVVSNPWVDAASAAGQTMEWLANHGYTGLLHRTVVVLNDSDGHADRRTRSVLVEQFSRRGQVVIEVPYDGHLRPGGVIDIDHELGRVTRRRFTDIAAAIAEHFVTTTDGPRERR